MCMCYSCRLFFIKQTKDPILIVHGLEKSNIICKGDYPSSWTIRTYNMYYHFFSIKSIYLVNRILCKGMPVSHANVNICWEVPL